MLLFVVRHQVAMKKAKVAKSKRSSASSVAQPAMQGDAKKNPADSFPSSLQGLDLHPNSRQLRGNFVNIEDTVDGWNPANQLRLVVYPIIYRVSYIPGGAGPQLSTVCHIWDDVLRKKQIHQPFDGGETRMQESQFRSPDRWKQCGSPLIWSRVSMVVLIFSEVPGYSSRRLLFGTFSPSPRHSRKFKV